MKHIVAIGGMLPAAPERMIAYSLRLTGKPQPTLGFVGTASGDSQAYQSRFDRMASQLDCRSSTLLFFDRTVDVADWVAAQDVILVGGGNTKSMLAVWQEWGLPELLHQAWERGTVLTGWSAGAICWFEQGVTDSFADRLESLPCLGFLPGSCCPHYSGEVDRRPAFHKLVQSGRIGGGVAIDDGAGIHYVDLQPHAIVAQSSTASAYQLRLVENQIVEAPMDLQRVELDRADPHLG